MENQLSKDQIAAIADRYDTAPNEIGKLTPAFVNKMRWLIGRQFGVMSAMMYVDFVDNEPYDYVDVEEMIKDRAMTGRIKVNTTGNNSSMWGSVYNLLFRAIHDIVHVIYRLDFNFNDEYRAWKEQVKTTKTQFMNQPTFCDFDWDLFEAVLRSEIVYQAAWKESRGIFHLPEQKIILTNLID